MAVFVSASDESSGANHLSDFQFSGFFMPEQDWSNFFVPSWQERVLDGPPKIPYLHMTEMRSKAWRDKHGITQNDADDRLDEAARIIDTMGSLYPVKITVNGALFKKYYSSRKMKVASGGLKKYEPDYYAFNYYVYAVLKRLSIMFPEAEKVDFIVESKSTLTKHLSELYSAIPDALRHVGNPELIPLLGEFIPSSKERIPVQAADYLCWHSQRADAGTLGKKDIPRWNTMAIKRGINFTVPEDLMKKLSKSWDKKEKEKEKENEKL